MQERDRCARVIQREWFSNSHKRGEKKRIENLKKSGYKLERKIWREIPKEKGGCSPSKIMVFGKKSTPEIAVLTSDVRTH